MRRIKKLSVVLFFLVLQGCGESSDRIQEYLDSGESYFQQGNYGKAKVQFKNVIQIDNKQADAFYYLALIDEKTQNWRGMFANLSQVVKLDPGNKEARLKLGRLLLLSGQEGEALEQVEAVLKVSTDDADALALKGAILLKQGHLDEAMQLADSVLQQHPEQVDAISLKALIYQKRDNYPAALATLEDALAVKPDDLSLNLMKLQLHLGANNSAAVEQDYLDLIKRFPDNLEFSYALAKNYADKGQDDKALLTLREVIESYPDNLQPKLVLIDYLMKQSPQQAEQTIKDYIAQYPDQAELYFRLAGLYLSQNKLADAGQSLDWIVKNKPDQKAGLAAKVILAKIAVQEGNLKSASELVNQVLAADSRNFDALLLNARINLIEGQNDEAIASLRSLLRDYSESDEAMVLLAQAYVKKNAPELALENFRKALDLNPGNFTAVMPVVNSMLKSNDINRAEEVLQEALKIKPDHAAALQALAQVRLLKNDWLGTQKVADLISANPKGKGYSNYLSGKISQGQGLYQEAIAKYKAALAISPGLTDALTGLMDCYAALNQREDMSAYLEAYIQSNPDRFYPIILKSQLLTRDKRWQDAEKVLSQAIKKWPEVPELYEAMARVYFAQHDDDKAIASFELGLRNMPGNPRLSMLLASAYEQAGHYDKALETYESLVSENPDSEFATNNLVSLLLDHYSSEANIDRAVKLSARFEKSEQPYLLDTYGWALLKSGHYEQALAVFKKVVKQQPDIAVFKYHLGVAYHKTRDNAAAVAELEQALAIGEKRGHFAEKEAALKLLKQIKSEMPA